MNITNSNPDSINSMWRIFKISPSNIAAGVSNIVTFTCDHMYYVHICLSPHEHYVIVTKTHNNTILDSETPINTILVAETPIKTVIVTKTHTNTIFVS